MAWFKEFVPVAYLNDHVEKALHQAVGDAEAKTAIDWARGAIQQRGSHQGDASRHGVNRNDRHNSASGAGGNRDQSPEYGERISTSKILRGARAADVVVEIHAPEDLHRYLIGTRGVTMRSIQHESGARLFFPTTRNTPIWAEPSGRDMITIVGSQEACARARKLIFTRVSDYYSGLGSGVPIQTDHNEFGGVEEQRPPVVMESRHAGLRGQSAHSPGRKRGNTVVHSQISHDSPEIKACMKAMGQNGDVSWIDAARAMRVKVGNGKNALCAAIDACTKASDTTHVIVWVQAMTKAGGPPSEMTFNSAIKAYANHGDVTGAERWINAMCQMGFVPNAVSFNAVINRCARAGDVVTAERWLSLMRDAGSTPNQLTFNSIIQAHTLAADPLGAVRWFEAMEEAGVAPNEKTFSSIVNAHAQAKDIGGAERWFEGMQQNGFLPDVVSYNTVINACAQVRDVARAERWLTAMRESGVKPNQVTFNVMIKAHALSGDADGAERWFEKMSVDGFSHNLRSFSSMATAYGQAFTVSIQKVKKMVDELRALELHPDHEVLTSLLKCCAHASPPEPDVALAWFREFIPRAHLMTHVERALRQAVDSVRADAAISWAKETYPHLSQSHPSHGHRGTNGGFRGDGANNLPSRGSGIIDGLEIIMEIRAPEKCHRYLIGIRGAAIKQIQHKAGAHIFFPNTKNTPLRAQPSCKDAITIVGDKHSCDRAKELIFARLRNCRAYTGAAVVDGGDGATNSAQQRDATVVSKPSFATGSEGDDTELSRSTQTEVNQSSFKVSKDGQGAVKKSYALSPEALQTCARALRAAGMAWSRSAMVNEGIENAEPSKMIDMCTGATDTAGVVRWFEAMTKVGSPPNEVTFTSAIKAYGYKKNVRAAEYWFEAMQLVGFTPTEKAYSSIINAYARAKDVNGAEMWFMKMRDAGLKPDHVAYNIMINAHTTAKDLSGAERWFEDMKAAGFGRSQPLYASMALAYSTARHVPFIKVQALVQDMAMYSLHPDFDTLSSLLKCCSRASPPQPESAARWFREYIGTTFLSPTIEKTALPIAVGPEMAKELCDWARRSYPQCTRPTPVMDRRSNEGMTAIEHNSTPTTFRFTTANQGHGHDGIHNSPGNGSQALLHQEYNVHNGNDWMFEGAESYPGNMSPAVAHSLAQTAHLKEETQSLMMPINHVHGAVHQSLGLPSYHMIPANGPGDAFNSSATNQVPLGGHMQQHHQQFISPSTPAGTAIGTLSGPMADGPQELYVQAPMQPTSAPFSAVGPWG